MGPLLFITCINDVVTCISSGSDVNMFADDIALYRIIKTAVDHLRDVDATAECIREKDLQFNATKCKTMLVSRKRFECGNSSTDNTEWCSPGQCAKLQVSQFIREE